MSSFQIRATLALSLLWSQAGFAGPCDISWDGDKIVTLIAGRNSYLSIPLKDSQQRSYAVTVGQVQAFSEAKERISTLASSRPVFVICGDDSPNAFAGKGNNGDVVGVTTGMMRLVNGDRDMAAAVIGHEYAHHTHNHGAAGAQREQILGIAGLLLGLAVDARSTRRTGVATNVGQTLGSIGATLVSRKFDRDQEREADSTGFDYMVRAGFNPLGAIALADKMRSSGGSGLFFDSHPGWDERGTLFREMIASNPRAQALVASASRTSVSPAQPALASTTTVDTSSVSTYTTPVAERAFHEATAAYRQGNLTRAFESLKASAEGGYAQAQAVLGAIYERGEFGLQKDVGEAVRLYKLAAAQGNALAQSNLGFAYLNGTANLAKDEMEAVRLFRLSADQGFAGGQLNLGFAYSIGKGGLEKNDTEAVRLYRLAADQGNALAQSNLALMLMTGRGVAKNDEEAVRLLRLAANQKNPNGQTLLGFMYSQGRGGLPKDDVEALKYIRPAAESGFPLAIFALGVAHAEGRGGVEKNEAEGIRYWRIAASKGLELARQELAKRGLQP